MRLQEIRTNKLFGTFDHTIQLNTDERITIIHGPNGFGKTAILRLTAGLFQNNFSVFRSLPFESLEFEFDDGRVLTATRAPNADNENGPRVAFSFPNQPPFEIKNTSPRLTTQRRLREFVAEGYLSGVSTARGGDWLIEETGEIVDSDELFERYRESIPFRYMRRDVPPWFRELQNRLDVHLIQAHRLQPSWPRDRQNSRRLASVEYYSRELARRIQATLAEYAELSQSLDRSFPNRLVKSDSFPSLPLLEIETRLAELETRRKQLTDAGILEKDSQPPLTMPPGTGQIDESKIGVLTVYLNDNTKKLDLFDDLYSRIHLFQSIVNQRFLYKTMKVSREGFTFETSDGCRLASTSLSTGEQHEVVMLYELLFLVNPDSLILIDEPEISLHVAWQEQFLKDLTKITSLSNFDVIIATHSPQIISNRWDLTVELKGPAE